MKPALDRNVPVVVMVAAETVAVLAVDAADSVADAADSVAETAAADVVVTDAKAAIN